MNIWKKLLDILFPPYFTYDRPSILEVRDENGKWVSSGSVDGTGRN